MAPGRIPGHRPAGSQESLGFVWKQGLVFFGALLGELARVRERRPHAGGPPAAGLSRQAVLATGNELFAVPGVGEDEPVIIFKFAIIDLGKSYCDKNELIIKFISEINSTAIKQLAGAPGPRAVLPSQPPSPHAKPRLAQLGEKGP